ncbi:hypothetical protein MNBD_GAMMA05-1885 [hydrothermal vent metagenome]|uniref:Sulfotransferase domain-containing protein n=1 Tax=hydrothermal vent metagenome TaxID=652676 RepID=A0A3B0X849_9ZZZZ
MSKLVFLSGDFSSGSTLLWLLFRKTGAFHTLYEPLHERLREYLIYPLRSYEHHFFSENYFAEYKGYKEVFKLHSDAWGRSDFYLAKDDDGTELYRYLSYIIGMSFSRQERVALQFNRIAFKLGWLRKNFPEVPIIHIYREPEKQWDSIVRRSQSHHGREDVGQNSVNFSGMGVSNWCNQLQEQFPELRAENSNTGYERYLKLYNLSLQQHNQYADLSVKYEDLVSNFSEECEKIFDLIDYPADIEYLSQFVVPTAKHKPLSNDKKKIDRMVYEKIDRLGSLYARAKLRLIL